MIPVSDHDRDALNRLQAFTDSPQLYRLAQAALQLYPQDPNTVLIKLRQLGEIILQEITTRWKIDTSSTDKQHELLILLEYKQLFPDNLLDSLHALRSKGNQAVHELLDNADDAHSNLQHAAQLADWLYQHFIAPEKQAAAEKKRALQNAAIAREKRRAAQKERRQQAQERRAQKEGEAARLAEAKAHRQIERLEAAALRAQARAEQQAQLREARQVQVQEQLLQTRQRRTEQQERAAALAQARMLYEKGLQLQKKQPAQAANYYAQAAQAGHSPSMVNLALLYQEGRGVACDPERAFEWNTRAAALGNVIAQNNLAGQYAKGNGVAQDARKAIALYHQAAQRDYGIAQHNLATHYRKGDIVAQNHRQAVHWYKKAARNGVYQSQYWLGSAYAQGLGVRLDRDKALNHYRIGAEQGDCAAQRLLGNYYLQRARQGLVSYATAALWIGKAAENGDASAQFDYAMLYFNGLGVKRHPEQARYWLEKAIQQDYEPAINFAEKQRK